MRFLQHTGSARAPRSVPYAARPQLATQYVPPRNAVDRLFAGIWADCLRVAGVGIQDDFFQLGGDSLQAMELVQKLETDVGLRVSAADLFEHPTIEQLVSAIFAGSDGQNMLAEICSDLERHCQPGPDA